MLDRTAYVGGRLGFRIETSRGAGSPAGEPAPIASRNRDEPVLLTVDQAHLTGAKRLTELYEAANRRTDSPVVLAVAGRQRDDGTADWLPAGDASMRVSLHPLSDGAVHELITRRLGAPPTGELAGVVAQAAGNPLVLTELITGLIEEDAVRVEDDRATMVRAILPDRVRRLLHARLGQLSPRHRQLLQVAAAINENVDEQVICSVSELDEAGRRMLDQEGSSILLRPSGQGFRFRSVLAWRTVRNSMPALLRTLVRGDVATRAAAGAGETGSPTCDSASADACEWSLLTDIERSIAVLVSDGMTNRQIAKQVFLSPHTVNYHLRNTFRKLKITSRASLAGITSSRTHDHAGDGAALTKPPRIQRPVSRRRLRW